MTITVHPQPAEPLAFRFCLPPDPPRHAGAYPANLPTASTAMHLLKYNPDAKTLTEVPPSEFDADPTCRYFYVLGKRAHVPIVTPDGIGEIVWQHPDYQPPSPANTMQAFKIETLTADGWSDDPSLLGFGASQDDNRWPTRAAAMAACYELCAVPRRLPWAISSSRVALEPTRLRVVQL